MDDKLVKTRVEKLNELDIDESKWAYFTDVAVDEMYLALMKILKYDDNIQFMYFINSILLSIKEKRIDKIENFELRRDVVLTFDPETWIVSNLSKLKKSGIDISVHFNYNHRHANKSFGLTVLKGLCKFYNYTVVSKTRNIPNDEKGYARFYTIAKNEEKK